MRLVQFEYKKKIDKDMAEDTEKPVIRKKYIPPYYIIWLITNSNLFRKKGLSNKFALRWLSLSKQPHLV